MRPAALFLALLLATGAPADSHADALDEASQAEARKAIETGNARYLQALKRGDAGALASLYAEDATYLQPSGPAIRGRPRIQVIITSNMRKMPLREGTMTALDFGMSGKLAYAIGEYSFTFQPAGRKPRTATGRYLIVWKRDPKGVWRIQVDSGLPYE